MRSGSALLALSLTLLAAPLVAQERTAAPPSIVRGFVVDRDTRAPLAGAAVEFVELERTLIANAEGRLLLEGVPPGVYSLRVRQVGFDEYETQLTVTEEGMDFTVALGARPVMLEGVSAHAYRFGERLERRRRAYGGNARVIPRNLLTASAAPTAREALQHLGMVSLGSCGSGISFFDGCVSARGTLLRPVVTIDERPAFGLDELAMYRPHELYALEIYRGGRHIRAYTSRWVEREGRAGRRALQPLAVY